MKYKSIQYSGSKNIIRRRYYNAVDINYWLSNKDRINDQLTDETLPKKRHLRSIYLRDVKRLFGKYDHVLVIARWRKSGFPVE